MVEEQINPEYTMMRKVNENLYLSLEQMEILEQFHIDYKKAPDLSYLIMQIEESIDEENEDILNNLLDILEERNYYQYFNK